MTFYLSFLRIKKKLQFMHEKRGQRKKQPVVVLHDIDILNS